MKRRWLVPPVVIVAVLALLVSACGPAAAPKKTPGKTTPAKPAERVIKFGAMQDMSGATSDVGMDEALGVLEAFTYYKEHGGVNGRPIKMFQTDYGYRVPEAITTYKRYRDTNKVVAVLCWGTGDTEALAPTVAKDKIVCISSSFSGYLCDPAKFPYNFVYSSDYSTKARATLQYWYENYWKKDPRYKEARESGRKPRLAFFADLSVPYSTAPREAIKEQAKMLGFKILSDQDVDLWALEAKSQVLATKKEGPPDVVWHGNTSMSVANELKSFYKEGMAGKGSTTMHLVNIWGYDRSLIWRAPKASEEAIGAGASAFWNWDYPKKELVQEYAKKVNPKVPFKKRMKYGVQGWIKVGMLIHALKRMDNAGELDLSPGALDETRAKLKKYMEAEPFEFAKEWGSTTLNYTSKDHRPSSKVILGQIKGKKIVKLGIIDMKKRYPDLWPKWLGY